MPDLQMSAQGTTVEPTDRTYADFRPLRRERCNAATLGRALALTILA